jgi:hypothetical protein
MIVVPSALLNLLSVAPERPILPVGECEETPTCNQRSQAANYIWPCTDKFPCADGLGKQSSQDITAGQGRMPRREGLDGGVQNKGPREALLQEARETSPEEAFRYPFEAEYGGTKKEFDILRRLEDSHV